jgi:hypothetical protein
VRSKLLERLQQLRDSVRGARHLHDATAQVQQGAQGAAQHDAHERILHKQFQGNLVVLASIE